MGKSFQKNSQKARVTFYIVKNGEICTIKASNFAEMMDKIKKKCPGGKLKEIFNQ